LEKGLAFLREAVARRGGSAVIRYHLGVALQEYGSRAEARRQLAQALAMNDSALWGDDARRRLEDL
jgi:Flp pilus assembly protein TadD